MPIEFLEIGAAKSFLDAAGKPIDLGQAPDLGTLTTYVETAKDTYFQFAQSISMNEQVVTTTISRPSRLLMLSLRTSKKTG